MAGLCESLANMPDSKMVKSAGELWVCSVLARLGWGAALTRDGPTASTGRVRMAWTLDDVDCGHNVRKRCGHRGSCRLERPPERQPERATVTTCCRAAICSSTPARRRSTRPSLLPRTPRRLGVRGWPNDPQAARVPSSGGPDASGRAPGTLSPRLLASSSACRGWAWLIQDRPMGPIGRALVDIAGHNDASTKGRA